MTRRHGPSASWVRAFTQVSRVSSPGGAPRSSYLVCGVAVPDDQLAILRGADQEPRGRDKDKVMGATDATQGDLAG